MYKEKKKEVKIRIVNYRNGLFYDSKEKLILSVDTYNKLDHATD